MTDIALNDVQPGDCYARAKWIEAEVELIRAVMGRPKDRRAALVVKGAAPRECYFGALALFRKADRLCYEVTGDQLATVPYAAPVAQLKPGHVLAVLDAAGRELGEVKSHLGITEKTLLAARDPAKTPSDVFGAMATVNRQVNLLLERAFAPGDVFQQVALAVAYATRLLAPFTGGAKAPVVPTFEPKKRPSDCFDRLSRCLEALRTIITHSGLTMLVEGPARGDAADVLPSDCYDLATTVLAELAFLHGHLADANPLYPFEANLPGRKLPAHVNQLAGALEGQLAELAKYVDKNPAWLNVK